MLKREQSLTVHGNLATGSAQQILPSPSTNHNSLGVVKDIRILIGKLVWETRDWHCTQFDNLCFVFSSKLVSSEKPRE
jgi:hypothetical protein